MCGGTGMYLESVLKGYKLLPVPENPELRARLADKSLEELTEMLKQYKALHNTTDVDTVKRAIRAIEIERILCTYTGRRTGVPETEQPYHWCRYRPGITPYEDINRLRQRLDEGMVDEVRRLIEQGIQPDDLIYYGLEYKYLTLYVIGKLTYEKMYRELEIAIHQFAKRQMTWFREWSDAALLSIGWMPGCLWKKRLLLYKRNSKGISIFGGNKDKDCRESTKMIM